MPDRRPSLEDRRASLEEAARRGQLDSAAVEALAEASCRLALGPGVAPAEAIRLLRRAIRLDGTNPKHAYLLALTFFSHGDFDRAARWLRAAVRHSPTSHRIWSHIALLQRELNARYRGNDAFEPDDLRRRSAEMLRRVRAGLDQVLADHLEFQPRESTKSKHARLNRKGADLGGVDTQAESAEPTEAATHASEPSAAGVPPQPSPRRFTRPANCRWSGAADLALEGILESPASELTCEKGLPLLRQAARLAGFRRGGVAGFAILGIQWCAAGYPVESVERLRRTLPREPDSRSLRLLDLVCHCCRLPPEDLPQALSEALARDEMTPLLAAVLHHRYLLWQPLDAKTFVKHSAGRRFQARQRESKEIEEEARASETARALTQTATAFAPRPRPRIHDRSPVSAVVPDQIGELAIIEDAVREIEAIVKAVAPLVTGSEASIQLMGALHGAADRAAERLDGLAAASFDQTPDEEFRARGYRCRRALNSLLYAAPLSDRVQPVPDAGLDPPDLAAWHDLAVGILAQEVVEPGSPTAELEALEEGAREAKVQMDADWQALTVLLEAKKSGALGEADVDAGRAAGTRVDEIVTMATTRIRDAAALRAKGVLAEIKRLDETERAWREIASSQGRFRRVMGMLQLPAVAATPSAPAPTGPLGVERAMTSFAAGVSSRFQAALSSFQAYTPAQRAEPELAALEWSVLSRQGEALYRLGRKKAARLVWAELLTRNRLAAPVLRNIAVSFLGEGETGRELHAWRDYAEALYFQACVTGSPRTAADARAAFHRDFGGAWAPACFQADRRDDDWSEADDAELAAFLDSPVRVRSYVTHKRAEWLNRKLDFGSGTLVLGCSRNDPEKERAAAKEKLLAFVEDCCESLPQHVHKSFCETAKASVESAWSRCSDVRRMLADPGYESEKDRQSDWVKDIVRLKIRLGGCIIQSRQLPLRVTSLTFLSELRRLDDVPMDLSSAILGGVNPKARDLVHYMSGVGQHFLQQLATVLDETDGDDVRRGLRERQFARLTGEWLEQPAVRGALPIVQFFLRRLEVNTSARQFDRVFEGVLLLIRSDDRRAGVCQIGLENFRNAAHEAKSSGPLRDVAAEAEAWIARAETHLTGLEGRKETSKELSREGIAKVKDQLSLVLVEACLAPLVHLKPEQRRGQVEGPLDDLVREHPLARFGRMQMFVQFAKEALDAKRNDEGKHWLQICKQDADAVIANPNATPTQREHAKKLRDDIQKALR